MKKFTVIFIVFALMFAFSTKDVRSEAIKHYDMAGTLQLGLALPMGDWSDDFEYPLILGTPFGTSFGIQGAFEYKVTEDLSLQANIGFIQWSPKIDQYNEFTYYSIPITLSINYYFSATKDFRPYAGVDVGVHQMNLTVDDHVYRRDVINDMYIAYSPLVGALIPFGQDDFFLNSHIKFTIINTEGFTSPYLSLWAGITYPF